MKIAVIIPTQTEFYTQAKSGAFEGLNIEWYKHMVVDGKDEYWFVWSSEQVIDKRFQKFYIACGADDLNKMKDFRIMFLELMRQQTDYKNDQARKDETIN